MSNPTELPDMEAERILFEADTAETFAAATFGRFPVGGNYNVTWVQEQWNGWQRAIRACRSQPEGEAPQADMHKLDAAMSLLRVAAECDVDKISPAKLRNQVRESVADAAGRNGAGEEYIFADVYDQLTEMLEPWMFRDGRDPAECRLPASVTESVEMLLEDFNRPAATLSPLCGAQHAATGDRALLAALAEAADVFMKGGVAPLRPLIDRAKAVAAQQAAVAGTPEAPADLPRLYRFDCYVGKTKMAAGVGVHASTMEEAEQKARKLIDKEETIKFESNQPCHPTRKCSICAAYERAAQLDGGQEGSAA